MEKCPKSERIRLAKLEFFDGLSNYIPLGSLTLPIGYTVESLSESEWQENGSDEGTRYGFLELRGVRYVRTFIRKHQIRKTMLTLRVYVLPFDTGRYSTLQLKDESRRRGYMQDLMKILDPSLKAWEGLNGENFPLVTRYVQSSQSQYDSLPYLFNTVQSPSPNPEQLSSPIGKEAVTSILHGLIRGLKTQLYPFQRRSSATMIARELEPSRSLDPRFELYVGPTGFKFFFDQATGILLHERRDYDEVRGGILAETMGYGKTLICLAVILATKGHWPQIPPQYSLGLNPIRPKVGTLREMAAATIGRAQIPWRAYIEDISEESVRQNCLKILEDNIGSYIISPPSNGRDQRYAVASKPRRIILCSATLVIVPPNLIYQWSGEISLHLDAKALKVLVVDNLKTPLPQVYDLLSYDIILMVKNRFEKELKHFQCAGDICLTGECTCYGNGMSCSPLVNLHFLRIIVDEGHGFVGSGNGNNATVALEKLRVERRWIVSGTPTAGLLGVELDTAAREVSKQEETDDLKSHKAALEAIRHQSTPTQEVKDVIQLGRIVVKFFGLQPWANKGEDPASWHKYVVPSSLGRKPRCLKSILESLVVRHRIEDIEQDLHLPPLYNRRVYLQPSWHDKMSVNLFILGLKVNAITSERKDQDYMFHPANRTYLEKVITKLRQSCFYWVGFSPQEVNETLEICRSYQAKINSGEGYYSFEDRIMLDQIMDMGEAALSSVSRNAFAQLQEMGMYVEDFPAAYSDQWSLVQGHTENPLLVGATQLSEAQKRIDSNLHCPSAELCLAYLENSSVRRLQHDVGAAFIRKGLFNVNETEFAETSRRSLTTYKQNVPLVPKLREENTMSRPGPIINYNGGNMYPSSKSVENTKHPIQTQQLKYASVVATKSRTEDPFPSDSPLRKARIVGTASAKLTYLIDRVIALQRDEKILIFYQGDHIAYFIAQAFDVLKVFYLIFTATLGLSRQSVYRTTFNTTETFRVMLMDLKQAAHGLNIFSASRVFFVNPVWQPNVEAQAIKRAHRMGQKRPVYVETLILHGTIEAQMLERRKQMSTEEHQKAKNGPTNDPVMGNIIRNAEFIPLAQSDRTTTQSEMASLETPQLLFGRVGKQKSTIDDPDADLIFPEGVAWRSASRRSTKRRRDSGLAGASSTIKKARDYL